MKKITLFLSVFLASVFAQAQDTITNPGFERWSNFGNYDEPNANWHTLNPLTSALGIIVGYKVTAPADVHSGSSAIKLITKTVLGSPKPSLVTTGIVNVTQQTIDGGCPISARPVALNGWYKFAPQENDTAGFTLILTKWNGTSRDTIGKGGFYTSNTVSEYTSFSVPVNYLSAADPDTVQLLFVSGGPNYAHVGSTLFLDDIAFDFSTDISVTQSQNFKLYPNPAQDQALLTFNSDKQQYIDVCLLNAMGQMVRSVYSGSCNSGQNQIQVLTQGLPTGIYWLRYTANGINVTEKLIVK